VQLSTIADASNLKYQPFFIQPWHFYINLLGRMTFPVVYNQTLKEHIFVLNIKLLLIINKRAQRALERSPETEGFLNSLFSLL